MLPKAASAYIYVYIYMYIIYPVLGLVHCDVCTFLLSTDKSRFSFVFTFPFILRDYHFLIFVRRTLSGFIDVQQDTTGPVPTVLCALSAVPNVL
jgi:hypothetical protein